MTAPPAVAEVLNNVYLCMAIAEKHPTAYSRLMLVSRRFYDWLNGEEEIVVFDPVLRTFRKKVVDKKAFKQAYKESWVVEKRFPALQTVMRVFSHSSRLTCCLRGQPSTEVVTSPGLVSKVWAENGKYRNWRDGPGTVQNWPPPPPDRAGDVQSSKTWYLDSDAFRVGGPANIWIANDRRAEEWNNGEVQKSVIFGRYQPAYKWIPERVTIRYPQTGNILRLSPCDLDVFRNAAGEAHVEEDTKDE
jgi:hypothetical protein